MLLSWPGLLKLVLVTAIRLALTFKSSPQSRSCSATGYKNTNAMPKSECRHLPLFMFEPPPHNCARI